MKMRAVLITLVMVLCATCVMAQRRVTPVEPVPNGTPETKPTEMDRTNVVERTDDKGNVVLVDTLSGSEFVDTLAVVPKTAKMQYPLWNAVTVGVNIWDPIMRILGQQYGGADVWAELSLHNRYKPVIEFGLSAANITPEEMNYTFKSSLAPYFKLGINYNIFYNSNSNYQFNVGLRYAFTTYSYEVVNVTVNEGYWDDPSHFSLPSARSTAGWLEVVAGVKVLIAKPVSLGWNVKYCAKLHESAAPYGEPMYIPGFGKRKNPLSVSFSVMYTLELNGKTDPHAEAEKKASGAAL